MRGSQDNVATGDAGSASLPIPEQGLRTKVSSLYQI